MKNRSRQRLLHTILGALFIIAFLILFATIFIYAKASHIHWFTDIDKELFGAFGEFIGGVVGTIFSMITSILVFITYRAQQKDVMETKNLLRKQINLSVKPDLYFANSNLYGFPGEVNDTEDSFITEFSNSAKKAADGSHLSTINVELVNIGVGVAKNVEFFWDFDLDAVQAYLNQKYDANPLRISKVGRNFIEFKIKGCKNSVHMGETFYRLKRRFDILLSHRESLAKIQVPFPKPFLIPYFIAVKLSLLKNLDNLNSFMALDDFPKCFLRMSYQDISGKVHNKVFDFRLSGHGQFHIKNNDMDTPSFGYELYANEIADRTA